jgi:hypothetical protein
MPIVIAIVALALAVLLAIGSRIKVNVRTHVRVNDLRAMSKELDARIVEHMQANYSGEPSGLEAAVRGLPALAREVAQRNGKTLDERLTRSLLIAILSARRYAPRDRVEAAVAEAMGDRRAA